MLPFGLSFHDVTFWNTITFFNKVYQKLMKNTEKLWIFCFVFETQNYYTKSL